jgi:hypothetical protein
MTVFACFGHWYVSLIYAAPAVLLAGGLGISTMREKRRRAAGRPARRGRMAARIEAQAKREPVAHA